MPGDRELTTAGAILEAALHRPGSSAGDIQAGHRASTAAKANEVEDLVASVFTAVLGTDAVSRGASFTALGGDSLMAISILSRVWRAFDVKLPIRALVPDGSVASLAKEVQRMRRAGIPSVSPLSRRAAAGKERASESQAAVWFMESSQNAGPLYNIPYALRLDGSLEVQALHKSLDRLVQRHQALRMRFTLEDGQLLQEPTDATGLELGIADVSELSKAAREPRAWELANGHVRTPIELANPPLIRPLLVKLAQDDHLLVLAVHHIVCDAWSIKLMMRDFAEGYGSRAGAEPCSNSPEFLDFVAWQRQILDAGEGDRLTSYWRKALDDFDADPLPTDYPRSQAPAYAGEVARLDLPGQLVGDVRRTAGEQGMTLYMTLLAAYSVAISSYADRKDVTVGSPVANREQESIEGVVGYVANMLPMRIDLTGNPTLRELFKRVRATALDAYEHQAMPFPRLVRELAPARHIGCNPIFQTGLILNDMTPGPIEGARASEVILHTGTSKLDLSCYLEERRDGSLAGHLEYASALLSRDTVLGIRAAFERVLGEIAVQVDRPLDDVISRICRGGGGPARPGGHRHARQD